MAAKPTPGGSDGTYGTELNEFLDISLADDGKIKTEALQSDATAPVADAAVANKKYVDDNIGSANWTPTAYVGAESVTYPNGLIEKTGFVATGATTGAVSFGVDFPTEAKNISVASEGTADFNTNVTVNTLAVGGFNWRVGTANQDFYWRVIGR